MISFAPEAVERRRRQNLSAPRPDARGVTPSIRNFAQAIDRQRQGVERIPLLRAARPDLLEVAAALDAAEAVALAIAIEDPQQELARVAEVSRTVSVPVLRADLILEEFQVYETRAAGCDALLLHPGLASLEPLARAAHSTHQTAIVVCRSAEDVARAAAARVFAIALQLDDRGDLPPLAAPPRTLVVALPADGFRVARLRGRADAVLDERLGGAADPAGAFRAALLKDA